MKKVFVIKNLCIDSYFTEGHCEMTNIRFAQIFPRYEDAELKLFNDEYFSKGGAYQIIEIYINKIN